MKQFAGKVDSLPGFSALGHDFWAAILTVIGCEMWRVLMLFRILRNQFTSSDEMKGKPLLDVDIKTTLRWRTHPPCCSKDNLQKWHWSSVCWREVLAATVGRRQSLFQNDVKVILGTLVFLICKSLTKWKVHHLSPSFKVNKIKDQNCD